MKKLMLLLACAALPMVAFADTPTKTTTAKKHKAHKTAASPAPDASPAASPTPVASPTVKAPSTKKASPTPKASPSPAAK